MSNPLIGLTSGVNDRDQAYRDMAQTESLYGMMNQKKQAEMQAQQMEAAAFDEMYKQSDTLLEKDRKRINKKILLTQSQLRDQIGEAGGSKKDFFEKGGISALNNIKNSIIRSEENIRYQENKNNLTMIRLAEKDGLGHLITPQDRKSLEDYYNNPDGATITYTGIMNEIKVPPSENFEFGKEIDPYYVATYDGNMGKVLGNYKMIYPDREIPDPATRDGMAEIRAFVRQQGWGGTGNRMIPKATTTTDATTKDTRTAAQRDMEDKVSYTNNLLTWHNNLGQPSIDDILSAEGGYVEKLKNGDSENGVQGDKMSKAIARQKTDIVAEYNGINEKSAKFGLDLPGYGILTDIWDDIFDSNMVVKDSYKLFDGNTMAAAKAVLGEGDEGYTFDGKYVMDYMPRGNVYAGNGMKIGKRELKDEYKGKYEVLGIQSGWKVNAGNGNDQDQDVLMVDVVDRKGNIDKEGTAKVNAGYKGENSRGTAKAATLIALRNENGDTFYHEIDLSNDLVSTKLSNILAENNNLSETVQLQNTTQERQQAAQKITAQQRATLETAKQQVAPVFQGPDFGFEMEEYQGAGSGGQKNRDQLAKAFYLAADYTQKELQDPNSATIDKGNVGKLVENRVFSQAVASSEDMKTKMRDYDKYNNEQLIQEWYEEVNAGLDPKSQEYRVNTQTAIRWKQFLQNY